MFVLTKQQRLIPALKHQSEVITDTANNVVEIIQTIDNIIPKEIIRINFRMLVSSLNRHGVSDIHAACDLAKKYFCVGEKMVVNPWNNRWRHILISHDMTETAKVKELSKLLKHAQDHLKINILDDF